MESKGRRKEDTERGGDEDKHTHQKKKRE